MREKKNAGHDSWIISKDDSVYDRRKIADSIFVKLFQSNFGQPYWTMPRDLLIQYRALLKNCGLKVVKDNSRFND